MLRLRRVFFLFLVSVFIQLQNGDKLFAQSPLDFMVDLQSGCSPLIVSFNTDTVNYNTFLWKFGDGSTSALASPQHVYSNSGNYTVSLIASGNGGLVDTVVKQSLITINSKPVADFALSASSICQEDEPFIITNLSANFSTCFWDFGDGTTSTTINPVHTYALNGNYSISLIVYDANGCFGSKDLFNAIKVNPKPSGYINASTNSTCNENELLSFSFSNSNVFSYLWSFGDGSTSSSTNPVHNYGIAGIFGVSLITQNQFGCVDTTFLPAPINIMDHPVPNLLLSDSIFCSPKTIYASTNTQGINTYHWTGSNGFSSSNNIASLSFSNSDTISLRLDVEYQNGCSNSDSVTIVALPSPNPTYSIINPFSCSSNAVQFVNHTNGNYLYNWDFGDSTFSAISSPSHYYQEAGIYVPILTATDLNGCYRRYATNGWIQIEKPLASFSTSVESGCEPLQVEFVCTSQGINQYYWIFGDGSTSIDANPTHLYNQSGNYDVTLVVTDINGCTDTLFEQNYISVGVENVQINSQIINGCAPFNVEFTSINSNGNHFWNFGDGTLSTLGNPRHTFSNPGVYTVSYNFSSTSASNCSYNIPVYATYVIGGGKANYKVEQGVCPPYTASFTDSSQNAISWSWNFGDNTYSTDQHPTHIYTNPGYYNVTLAITSADGCTRSVTKKNVVSFEPLFASPDAVPLNTTLPLNVQFYANSTGATNWYWDFGDGTSSTLENPLHSYAVSGPYSLSLVISKDTCSKLMNFPNITLGGGSTPLSIDSIVYSESSSFSGCVPYTIEFNSPKKNAISYVWYFGTGDSSIIANPTYVYEIPGLYDVVLITQDSSGLFDTTFYSGSVNLYGISAKFSTDNFIVCDRDSVIVTAIDSTANNYLWNFGDGFTATGSIASHIYNQAADYFLSLRISDSLGCEVLSNQLYTSGMHIQVSSNKINACVLDTISFTSIDFENLEYLWNFGDGSTSSDVNPIHAYLNGGEYTVTLILQDSTGCLFTADKEIQISVYEPKAEFDVEVILSDCKQVYYKFTNKSENDVSWHWQFGDGATSFLENPGHMYTSFGTFDVSLTVSKYNCSSTKLNIAEIDFKDIKVDFSFVQNDKCFPIEVQFQNFSQNANNYLWNFGDGITSNDFNPSHTYYSVPSDSISLLVSDNDGCAISMSMPMMPFIEPSFSVSKTEGCSPLEIEFINGSVGYDSLTWLINDSLVSNLINPKTWLVAEGFYDVSLILHSALGCNDTLRKDSLIYVSNPVAKYSILDSVVCKPAILNFINQSNNINNFVWNFGDGSSSQWENPTHIYNEIGAYYTSLIGVSNLGCSDTFLLEYPIAVQGPEAKFFLASVNVCEPKALWFNDSSAKAAFWFWDFGDGYTSTFQHPVHYYIDDGNYNVSLIVSDSIGCTSIYEYPNGVNIVDYTGIDHAINKTVGCTPLEVALNLPINFSDSLLIDFGDGKFGSKYSTSHIYSDAGIYQVKFIRINEWGCKDTTVSDTITIIQQPVAKFKVENGVGCAPVSANIVNLSTNLSNPIFSWNLGFTNASNDSDFVIEYVNSGVYDVSLVVINEFLCSDTFFLANAVQSFDNTVPQNVRVDFVSVANSEKVEIQWRKNIEPDIDYYNLYRLNLRSGLYDLIYKSINDTKQANQGIINYFNKDLNTGNYRYDYKVQAVNYCNNKVPINDILPDNSILLRVDSVSPSGIYLSWNMYKQCHASGYEIYRAELATGSYSIIETVNNDVTSFVDSNFACPQLYLYFIKAISLCSTSFISKSNEVIAEPFVNLSNQRVKIVRSTVVDDRFILTEWLKPDLLPDLVLEYIIYRSIDNINFSLVDRVPSYITEFIDMDVSVDKEAYFYKIIPVNICDVEAMDSNNSSSILLQSEYDDEITKLKWSKYTEWEGGVEKYVIERMDQNGNWKVIKEVNGATFMHED